MSAARELAEVRASVRILEGALMNLHGLVREVAERQALIADQLDDLRRRIYGIGADNAAFAMRLDGLEGEVGSLGHAVREHLI
jgi:hypothetical protein